MKNFLLWLWNRRAAPEPPSDLLEAQRKTEARKRLLERLEYEREFLEREQEHDDDLD